MYSRDEFQIIINQVRSRIRMVNLLHLLIRSLILFLVILTLIFFLDQIGFTTILTLKLIFILYFISCLISAVMVWLKRKNILQELIKIDNHLENHDTISTAYELHILNQSPAPVFFNQIINHAVLQLRNLEIERIIPIKVPEFTFLIPVSLVLIASLTLFDKNSSRNQDIELVNPIIQEKGHDISDYLNRKKEKSDMLSDEHIENKATRLADDLKSGKLNENQARTNLSNLRRELQAGTYRKISRLETELNMQGEKPVFQENIPRKQSNKKQLKKLIQKLNDAFDNKIPVKIKKDISQLEQDSNFEEFLNMTIESLNQSNPDDSNTQLSQQGESPNVNDQTNDFENREMGTAPRKTDNTFKNNMGNNSGAGENMLGDSDQNGTLNEQKADENTQFTAGTKISDNTKQDPDLLEPSENDITQDTGLSSKGKGISFSVRALTSESESTLPEQDVRKTFKKQLENVLIKEDIPVVHREYIKTYFLSIGLGGEEDNYGEQ